MNFDLFLAFSVTVYSVSVLEEYLDLSNEVNLFSAMSFSIFFLIGFSKPEYNAFCSSILKLPTASFIWSYFGCINKTSLSEVTPLKITVLIFIFIA